jgi:uncharacterized protein with von Willebrand factor type A (vWA) domain
MEKVSCHAKKPAMLASAANRAYGRMVKTRVMEPPETESQADLVGDVFQSLYQPNPALREIDTLPPSRQINHALMKWAMSAPGFDSTPTAGNLAATLASTGLLWEGLQTEEALQDALEAQFEAEQEEEQAKANEEAATQSARNGSEESAQEYMERADGQRQQAQEIAQQALSKIDKLKDNPMAEGMMMGIVKDAQEAAQEVNTAMQAWGIEPGGVSFEEAQEVIQFANNDVQSLSELVDWIGRMEGIASATIQSTKAGHVGIVSEPALTRDVMKLFPNERAYVSNRAPDVIRLPRIQRLLTGGGLLGWKPTTEGQKSGAFLALIDKSGSMGAGELTLAKSISLGVAKAVVADDAANRFYSLHYFAGHNENIETLPGVTSKDPWQEHVRWAQVRAGGGTSFDTAFTFAVKKINEYYHDGIDGADILFITDGVSVVSDEVERDLRELMTKFGTRLVVINIGSVSNQMLEDLAVAVIPIVDLSYDPDNIAEQIARALTLAKLD